MPFREKNVPCPGCAGLLSTRHQHGIDFAGCSDCGGHWIAEQGFFSLLHHLHPGVRMNEVMVHNDGSPRVPCPICRDPMEIGWLDFLQVDRCEHGHGLWFEAEELERALAYKIGQDVVDDVANMARHRKNKRKGGIN